MDLKDEHKLLRGAGAGGAGEKKGANRQ
eukprot:SAG22_NODE_6822_length_807_cov_1.134181_1_plen_27_part_10